MLSIPADLDVIQATDPLAMTHALQLPGLLVTQLTFARLNGWVILAVQSAAPRARCPRCQQFSSRVHQYHPRLVRDLPWAGHPTYLRLARRRFKCGACRRPFTEELAALAPHGRTTRRYAAHLVAACRTSTIQAVARAQEHGYKAVEGIVYRAAAAAHPEGPPPYLIKRLGLDEIAAHKGHGQYKLVLSDLDRHAVIEQLANRDKETLRRYLLRWSPAQRAAVEEVAVDFWAAYHDVAAELLPHARVVGDRFHAQKQVNAAVNTTRLAVQRRLRGADREFLRQRRGLFLRNEEDLAAAEEIDLLLLKEYCPALERAHTLKEELRTIFNRAQDRASAAGALAAWLERVATSGVAALVQVGEFVARWREPILNYFVRRTNSGVVEGLNNKIKLVKRLAFGFGNDTHFRLRVLMACDGRV
jgi:transposase